MYRLANSIIRCSLCPRRQITLSFFRTHKHWEQAYLRDLWNRRQLLGADELIPRSKLETWNETSELFAFGKRLGEDFRQETISRVFIHPSFPGSVDDGEHNLEFVQRGEEYLTKLVKGYLRYHLSKVPEEAICAICDHLTSKLMLANIGRHLGMVDLIKSADFPVEDLTVADTLKAVVGGLLEDQGPVRAAYFIQDFVLTMLVGVDLDEVLNLKNPMGVLVKYLEARGWSPPEPRLLRSAGAKTITPVYIVGIYSEQELLGESPGETLTIAEEMAARDALWNLWGLEETREPFSFGDAGRNLDLAPFMDRQHWSLEAICSEADRRHSQEPLVLQDLFAQYKDDVERSLGTPYRRRLRHKFSRGTYNRRTKRSMISPTPHNI